MSKHNYSQYSNKKNNDTLNRVAENLETTVLDVESISGSNSVAEVKMVTEPREVAPKANVEPAKPAAPKPVIGTVFNCNKLNVRVKPTSDADVLTVLEVGSEVKVDIGRSTSDWYKICTASGVDGFCMRKFIKR